jgi:hypothetical protein
LTFLRQVGVDAVWIVCLSVYPIDLGGFWIDLKTSFLADREPSFSSRRLSSSFSSTLSVVLLFCLLLPARAPGPGFGAISNAELRKLVTMIDGFAAVKLGAPH